MGLFDHGFKAPNGVSASALKQAIIRRGGFTRRKEIFSGFYQIEEHDAEGCTCPPCRNYRSKLLEELHPMVVEEELRIQEANCPNQFTIRKAQSEERHTSDEVEARFINYRKYMDDLITRNFDVTLPIMPMTGPFLIEREGYVPPVVDVQEPRCEKCEFKPCRLCKK